MESRKDSTKPQQLLMQIEKHLRQELHLSFKFANYSYILTSSKLLDLIAAEINNTIKDEQLSPAQIAIIEACEDIDALAADIAGKLNNSDQFNIVFKTGTEPTGLTKLYFDHLNPLIASFLNDLTLNTKRPFIGGRFDYDDLYGGNGKLYAATSDSLKGSYAADRKKQILNIFCCALLKHATPAQLTMLQGELANPSGKESLVTMLGKRRHETFDSFISLFTSKLREPEHFEDYKMSLETEISQREPEEPAIPVA